MSIRPDKNGLPHMPDRLVVTHKVILVGNSAVGKTAIINEYIYGSSSTDGPTVGVDFFAKSIKKGQEMIRMQIWDTAGQEKFHSLIPSYIRNSTVAVFVYDITCRESFDALETWYKMVTDLAEPTIVIVGNKTDLEGQREVTEDEGRKFAEAHNGKFIETSARTKSNINELFALVGETPRPQPKVEEEPKEEKVNLANVNKGGQSGGGICGC